MKYTTMFVLMLFIVACSSSQPAKKIDKKQEITDATSKEKSKEKSKETKNVSKNATQKSDTSKDPSTEEEKKVIYYTNLARKNGPLFAKTHLKTYLDSLPKTKRDNEWIRSLKKDLQALPPLNPVTFKLFHYQEAKKHALDMGKSGKIGHNSSTGVGFAERMEKLHKKFKGPKENCSYGSNEAMKIVMLLLIDENVPGTLHRYNMLHPKAKYIGTSIQSHKEYDYNCVMILSEEEQ